MTPGRDASARFPACLEARFADPQLLGAGGMGTVYRAHDRQLQRTVAVKVLHVQRDEDALRRFRREAGVMAALEHPAVLRIFDHGESPEACWIVLEYASGGTLAAWCREGPDPDEVLEVFLHLLDGLEALHGAGVVHRDVKPGNLLRCGDGRVVLADFGLVQAPDVTQLTKTGSLVGTLGYMAPECLQGAPATPASDAYAWGASLFQVLEGRLPWTQPQLLARAHGAGDPQLEFRVLDAGGPLAGLIRAALSRDPAARPRTRRQAEARLEAGPPPQAPAAASALRAPAGPRSGGGLALRCGLVALGTFLLTTVLLRWGRPAAAAASPATPPAPPAPHRLLRSCQEVLAHHRDAAGVVRILGGRGYQAHRDALVDLFADAEGAEVWTRWIDELEGEVAGEGGDLPGEVLQVGLFLGIDREILGLYETRVLLQESVVSVLAPTIDPEGPLGGRAVGPRARRALERQGHFRGRLTDWLRRRGDALELRGPVGHGLRLLLEAQVLPAHCEPVGRRYLDRDLRAGTPGRGWAALLPVAAVPWFEFGVGPSCAARRDLLASSDAARGAGPAPDRSWEGAGRAALALLAALETVKPCGEARDGPVRTSLPARARAVAAHLEEHPGWVDLAATWALYLLGGIRQRSMLAEDEEASLRESLRGLRSRARAAP